MAMVHGGRILQTASTMGTKLFAPSTGGAVIGSAPEVDTAMSSRTTTSVVKTLRHPSASLASRKRQ
jgi:hypothetical protein